MEELWEDNDMISKLLNNECLLDESTESIGEELSKSLHDEFMEIGEDYNIPIKKNFSLQNILQEFNNINQVVDDEIKRKQSTTFVTSELREETTISKIPAHPINLKKALRPPPGFEMKQISTVPETEKKAIRPPPGFGMKQISTVPETEKKSIRPPPGFEMKQISTVPETEKKTKNALPGLSILENSSTTKSCPPPPGFTVKTHSKRPMKSFGIIMSEFNTLSCMMDKELETYKVNVSAMQEQKQDLHENLKEAGRVDMLKTLLHEQQTQIDSLEKRHLAEIQQLKATHVKELAAKKETTNNSSGKLNDGLQMEFNKVLNEREEEIDSLNAMVQDLQYELESYQGGSDDIAMENEELLEKIQIKDEYISSLKFQMTNLEKLHVQDEWKLEQADDNLEMVEREQDKFESEANKMMKHLRDELLAEREKTHKMQHYIEVMHDKMQQQQQQQQQQQASRLQTTSSVDSSSPVFRQKLARMALRSVSNVSRVSSTMSSDKKVPTILKSLGWYNVQAQ